MSEKRLVWHRRMSGRNPAEAHRVATPVELLFDLCFVVAVAQSAAGLHHAIVGGHVTEGLLGFFQSFFATWWAWMNFTWFASAYDSSDMRFKLLALVNIVGALVMAAGLPRMFEHGDPRLTTAGYAIMRVSLVMGWLRAAREEENPGRARTARRYALGVTFVELGWLSMLLVPHHLWLYAWLILVPLELSVPMWAERTSVTRWHPHHIIERYSLMVLIVIGESVLSATTAVQAALDSGHLTFTFGGVIVGAVLVLFSFWWLYFGQSHHHVTETNSAAFFWGYGHYFVFASLAATGAGIGAATDILREGHAIWIANAAVAIPCAVYAFMLWLLCIRYQKLRLGPIFGIAVALLLGSIALPWPVLPAGVVMVALSIVNTFVQQKHDAADHSHGHEHRASDPHGH